MNKNNGVLIAFITWMIVLIMKRFINISHEAGIWFLIYFVIDLIFKSVNKDRN